MCQASEPLLSAMRYSLLAGGKRLRPSLALGVCDMLGGKTEIALRLGCAIELIHTYSLIHDDLPCMDDDDMRRGRPSNHKVYGEAQALLAGDALLTYAFERMLSAAQIANEAYYRGVLEIAKRAFGMVAGQSMDLIAENDPEAGEEELNYIHRHKTADLLTASVLAGAYSASADEDTIKRLEAFSEKMGLLFQITDDILDREGDPALMGKTLGKDEKENKLTFVSLYGLEKAKTLAEGLQKECHAMLDGAFAKRAGYLHLVIDYIVERNN
ncbi:MAG: polyprenyl synthetase family protein [Clostridia bacterium]|nr:polyprenyl synthetase family protein [Clostridia bacterium]